MTKLNTGIFVAALLSISSVAFASDRAVVEAFYSELLSKPNAADMPEQAAKVLVEEWVSIPTPRGGAGREGFVNTLRGFGASVPDLKWEPQEILRDGNRYIVRGKATGTPVKPMFGVQPSGKSFEVMSIDIHTVESGRIVQSYHVEEWLKAVHQLKPKK
ncbi:MAG: ester cyclase [Gammaproteobacteria bacterium]|nr:ester cyclase [Gammaproteobacteria bacterium]